MLWIRGFKEVSVVNHFAKISGYYVKLGGKLFMGTEDVIEVENWLLYYGRIFADLGLNDKKKRRLASRQLLGDALFCLNSVTLTVDEETMT